MKKLKKLLCKLYDEWIFRFLPDFCSVFRPPHVIQQEQKKRTTISTLADNLTVCKLISKEYEEKNYEQSSVWSISSKNSTGQIAWWIKFTFGSLFASSE